MNLDFDLDDGTEKENNAKQRIKEATKKKKAAVYEPTWKEVWVTGYTSHTGSVKKGIFQSNVSATDRQRLKDVKDAIEADELGVGVEDMRKFTKAHALRLYKQLQESKREETIEKMLAERPANYHTIVTKPAMQSLLADLDHEAEIAIDTETTGLDYFHDIIVGISITLPRHDYHVYIPFGHIGYNVQMQLPMTYVFNVLKPYLESEALKKIYFNAKFDIHMFRRHGIVMGGFLFDGLIAMKLLNENEPSYALKNLATKYGKFFGFIDKSATFESLFGKGGFQGVPIGIGSIYACKDTHLTYRFYKDFLMHHFDRLDDIKKLYFDIERPITEVCIEMEQNGFAIDFDFAKQYAHELQDELDEMAQDIEDAFGDININSPAQLQGALYDDWGLPDVSKKRSTDKKTLKKLAEHNEKVNLILEFRDIKKLLSTYVEALPQKIKADGRLHGQFNQADTVTGRFASKDPNLQNLPARARRLIVAPDGKIIIGIDFSQIEPRLLAHLANDYSMKQAYIEGRDLYVEMASKVFKLDEKYCQDGQYDPTGTFQPRKVIKAVLLGIMYGMGARTLSGNIGISEEYAKQIIADFMETYPDVANYIQGRHDHAEAYEFVTTMFGRKRRFPEHRQNAAKYKKLMRDARNRLGREPAEFIWDEKDTLPYKMKQAIWDVGKHYHVVNRQSVNATIQGSAADVMKLAMVILYEHCKKMGYKMVATVHDEVLIEMDETATREEIEELAAIMRDCISISIPMKVDPEIMERWGEGMDLDSWDELKATGYVTRNVKDFDEFYNTKTKMWEKVQA